LPQDEGWGWDGPSYHNHQKKGDSHMQLYTLLGGLSFISFLATAVILLTLGNNTRFFRSSSSLFRKSPQLNRKHDEEIEESHEVIIKVPEFIHKISKILSPWWYLKERQEILEMEPKVKLTRVPMLQHDDDD
jgi:hypothetical protein